MTPDARRMALGVAVALVTLASVFALILAAANAR